MIKILYKIIKSKSLTPFDDGCQKKIKKILKKIGFECFTKKFKKITNSIFFLKKRINKKIDLLFSCHSDVVSIKNIKKWKNNPFILTFKKGYFYARGVVDMKGSISCFIKTIKWYLKYNNNKNIMIIITSDEEGDAKNGTKRIVKILNKKKIKILRSLVGEPTSEKIIGDVIKIGRRGSLNLNLKIIGIQGHSAYPDKSINPISVFLRIFNNFYKLKIKKNNFQIISVMSNNTTSNIIPNAIHLSVNIRYTSKFVLNLFFLNLKQFFKKEICRYIMKIKNNSFPFISNNISNINWIYKTFKYNFSKIKISKIRGGTSDGRFLKKICKNCFELGLKNKYAHKYNEKVKIKEIYLLLMIYLKILTNI
ncbi:succinyl-diaminopimelate desuccinylase [Candidatus Vidania fulgoroideorum]